MAQSQPRSPSTHRRKSPTQGRRGAAENVLEEAVTDAPKEAAKGAAKDPSATRADVNTGRPSDEAAKPRWERRKDARPQEVISAAFSLFVERGFAATRLEDVALRAGVSKGTLYLYFQNKQELFKAVVRESLVPVIDEADKLLEGFEGPSASLFEHIMLGWWERFGATSRAGITKLVMAEAGNFPEIAAFYHEEVILRGNALIERLLARGIASGEFRAVDIPVARRVLMAPMLMLITWRHTFAPCSAENIDPEQYLKTFIDFSLNGLLKTRSAEGIANGIADGITGGSKNDCQDDRPDDRAKDPCPS